MTYPDYEAETKILKDINRNRKTESIVMTDFFQNNLELVYKIDVHDSIISYILDIVKITRKDPSLNYGVSTRGAIYILQAAKARALMHGRTFVIDNDVKTVICDIIRHRIELNPIEYLESDESEAMLLEGVIKKIVDKVPLPIGKINTL